MDPLAGVEAAPLGDKAASAPLDVPGREYERAILTVSSGIGWPLASNRGLRWEDMITAVLRADD